MRKTILAATVVAVLTHQSVHAATVPAAGYVYTRSVLTQLTEGCIAHAKGGDYVGVGPALSFPPAGGTRSILWVSDAGDSRVVATGFNSISDCTWDAENDVLYVTDSGLEFAGSTTGDTVFAIDGDAENATALGNELLPAGSIPYAFGIELFPPVGLLVSDAAGGGNGSVIRIDTTGVSPTTSVFANGFDYTGGILVDGGLVYVSEALEPSFDSAIYSYLANGNFQATVSGPTFAHGSNDLAIGYDGFLLATGGSTIVRVDNATPLVTGLDGGTGFPAFGGGVSVHEFTGRVDFLASSFSGADDDKSIHRLARIDTLVPGGGRTSSDCAAEIYGIELVPTSEGRPARSAICVDGDPCDADGAVDGGCTYPIGLCFNVSDPRLADCTPSGVASVSLVREKPEGAGAAALVAAATDAAPIEDGSCVFGDGVRVPLREGSTPGEYRRAKGKLAIRTTTADSPSETDTDVVRLVCEPALP